eukprot:40469_1
MEVENPTSIVIDVAIVLVSGIAIQCLKLFCRKKLYPWIAIKALKLDKDDNDTFHFCKQMWSFTWHSFCLIFEFAVVTTSDFWPSAKNPYNTTYGTTLFWGDPTAPSTAIRVLYLIQIGYYTSDFFYQQLIDKPNDYLAMGFHHVATLSLLWMSYLPPPLCWKIGCAILWEQDIGDVSITFCKAIHYAKLDTAANILFVMHILIWIWSRLIWFPRYIAALFVDDYLAMWQLIPCGILLCTLFLLHIYWTFLMFRVLYGAVCKKERLADTRDRVEKAGGDKEDVAIDLDEMDELKDRTDIVDDGTKPPRIRRRSSLMGSLIMESKDDVIASINRT